ncbi:MAG: MBL fold metallo-hydrolase [Micrococcales bacterium]|nr:MBL fold metallo-hydrolase [Micrococcales bacterium]
MVEIIPLDTPSLGDRSYLAHDGETALVIDPQRDYDRVLQLAEDAGVRITHVLETHIHNDYVTGGLALAEEVGAAYHVNADDPVAYDRVPTRSGDVIEVSPSMTLTAIATPGHTFTHLSYALSSHGEDLGVFTGGSLLFGSTGRPDLLGPEHTDTLARAQYASAHRVAGAVADDAAVFPTHGFGSFCSATQSDATASTIGREKRENPVLTQGEEEWVRDLLDGLDVHPAYYAHMGPANLAGPDAPDLAAPEPVDTRALRTRIERGEWVVDLRTGTAFAAGHVPGTFNIGVEGQFSTYVGWLKPWGADLTLLGETAEQVARAQRELVRIGIDQLAGSATGQPADWTDGELGSFPVATFAELEQVRHHRPVTVVDVRRAREYEAGHIPDAMNIPVHEVLDRADEAPEGELWVHCAGGYRAMVAGSILAARGRRVVVVDDSFDTAGELGLLG